jgi:UPF0716 protein FxsA
MWLLVLLFILIPTAELLLLIELGSRIGVLMTLSLVGVTGMLGAFLARRQGLSVWHRMREELTLGELPTDAVAHGVIILVAAVLLITPGLLTDTVGFLLLVPAVRRSIKEATLRRLMRAITEGKARVSLWYLRENRSRTRDTEEQSESSRWIREDNEDGRRG